MECREIFVRRLWIMTALAVAAIPACGQAGRNAPSATKPTPGQPSARPGELAAQVALPESDCLAYAQSVVKAVADGDPARLIDLVDWDSIFNAAVAGLDLTDEKRQDIFRGLRRGVDDRERGFAGQYIKISKQGGSLSFLRTRQSHGRRVILFRLIQPIEVGGVNYLEFVPGRTPGGQIRAVDIYVYASGEFLSETWRRTLLPMIADQSRTIVEKLVTGEQDYVRDLPQIGRGMKLLNEGKPKESLAIFKQLRPETRKQKVILLWRLWAAQRSDDDKEYAAAIEDFRKWFPDDPNLELISIDAFVLRGDFPGAMKGVDRLDQSLGGDPYLDTLRAGIREAQGDLEGARRFARKAIEREPSLLPGYYALVGYSLKAEKYDETLALLEEMDRKFDIAFEDLSQVPEYAGFVKSATYPEWLDYLKTKKSTPERAPSR
jgi:hypothetical protein